MASAELISEVLSDNGLHHHDIRIIKSLGGGSINDVLLIGTSEGNMVLKINTLEKLPEMFKAEADGLNALNVKDGPRIPQVILFAEHSGYQFLFLEYIEAGRKTRKTEIEFAQSLAQLHRHSASAFGWHRFNYMGSLKQVNETSDSVSDFFIHQRLLPQWNIALKQFGDELPDATFRNLLKRLPDLLPEEKPALIHGDLWGGNRITGPSGESVLIDPAVSYSGREADLSMTQLFGGFDAGFIEAYHEVYPIEPEFENRVDLWNLYPLLVHLNLFGRGYLHQIRLIINKFQ